MDIYNKVLNYIKDKNLITKGDSLICAVSGGADSVCMLDILVNLADEFSLKLYVAHLNHCLRGEEAERDEQFVKALCKKHSLPFCSKSVDVAKLSKKLRVSCEEAGRIARYEFFEELKEKFNVKKVCTAHNKNDNIETVLMRILRGTDISGLSGISPFNEQDVVRPVLCLSRTEIEEYLRCKGIDFVTDSTNAENDFTRNKIRNILIPSIIKDYNKGFVEAFSSNIEIFGEADSFLEKYANEKFAELFIKESYGGRIDTSLLLKEDKYIIKRIIKKAVYAIGNANITTNLCNIIFESLNSDSAISVTDNITVYIKYGNIYFVVKKTKVDFLYHIDKFGTYTISETGDVLEISEFIGVPKFCDKNTIYLPVENFKCDFTLRSRKNGDKMKLLKCGSKKISDILTDEKIPVFLRDDIPVLEYMGEILWLTGLRDTLCEHKKTYDKYIKLSIHKENYNA